MHTDEDTHAGAPEPVNPISGRRFGCLHVLGFMAVAVVVTAGLSFWWYQRNLNASPFTPTFLTAPEQTVLETKLSRLDGPPLAPATRRPEAGRADRLRPADVGAPLEPEAYSEEGARREVEFTEKELNALVARDEGVARRVAIDLADDLVSVKLLIPLDPDFPVLGGNTLRLNCGVTLGFEAGRPLVALRGVSLGGVPLPNAWLGDLKHRNLVEHFGSEGGFWDTFARGVEHIQVRDGHLRVKLRE